MVSGAGSSGSSWSAVRSGMATGEEASLQEISGRCSDISELSGDNRTTIGDVGTGVEWSGEFLQVESHNFGEFFRIN